MLGKARSRPDQVAKVMQSVATNGVPATYRKVMGKLDSYTPLGYSLCGVVEQVGAGIDDVAVGDLVACAGNEHALHAELNWVPKNLYARVPDGLAPRHAAFGFDVLEEARVDDAGEPGRVDQGFDLSDGLPRFRFRL